MKHLLAKYGRLDALRQEEAAVLEKLAINPRSYDAGALLVASELDEPDSLFLIDEGRLFASTDLPNGERAITRLYYAGDIVGSANVPFTHATQSITVLQPSVLFGFPRSQLARAFRDFPRLAAIFYTFAALENAILNDRLVSVGRTRGRSRLAALLLEIWARRRLTGITPENCFRIGLTQSQIGDCIGLTEVQVNRLIRSMDHEGLIARKGDMVHILRPDDLARIGQFRDRYEDLDISWFESAE
ncbi:Crp/Fnr family transcriptional regulator [Qipengyuania nanhaisediminis]|uniref:Crp/Fnr family transcriptional regulator n=1 Tax=Qipengyuania nanhaisediminis TaxID=604088 RepID=UPI0038B336EF